MPLNSAILVGRVAPRLSRKVVDGKRVAFAAFEFEGTPGNRERIALVPISGDPLPLGCDVLVSASLGPFADTLGLYLRTVSILPDGLLALPYTRRKPMGEQDVSGYDRRLRNGRVIKVKGYKRGGTSSAKSEMKRR